MIKKIIVGIITPILLIISLILPITLYSFQDNRETGKKSVDQVQSQYPNIQPSLVYLDSLNKGINIELNNDESNNGINNEINIDKDIIENYGYDLIEINDDSSFGGLDIPFTLSNTIIYFNVPDKLNETYFVQFNMIDKNKVVEGNNVIVLTNNLTSNVEFITPTNITINNSIIQGYFVGENPNTNFGDYNNAIGKFDHSSAFIFQYSNFYNNSTNLPKTINISNSFEANINNLMNNGGQNDYYINNGYIKNSYYYKLVVN